MNGGKLLVLGLLLAVSLEAQESRNPAFAVLDEVGIDQRLGATLPLDTRFVDSAGREIRLGESFGEKPVILSFVYYECPMLCTQVLNGLLATLRATSLNVGDEFNVVTISFDPGETHELAAAKKASYLESYDREGAETGWRFLTGDPEAIEAVTWAVGFHYQYQPEVDQFAHGSAIMIATPDGRLSRYYYGIEYAPREVRLGLVEASNEVIGSVVDQVLLFCFHYDPATGKYGLAIMNVMRAAGGLTVVGLVGMVYFMIRRERQAAPAAGA